MDASLVTSLECICVAFVAMLYAAVGHGGATGYIALLSLFGLQHEEIATTALILNTVVASIALANYHRVGRFQIKLALPYVLLSIPLAYVGARIPVDKQTFAHILGTMLALASLRFAFLPNQPQAATNATKKGATTSGPTDFTATDLAATNSVATNSVATNSAALDFAAAPVEDQEPCQPPPPILAAASGGILGLLSGMTGIGGGVFLSPIIIFKRWATTKQTSAISALFIVVNSISGLVGRFSQGKSEIIHLLPFLLVAVPAALIGSRYGAYKFSSRKLQALLALVLALAAFKLFQTK
ncbi:sulfite exporter TauE/SafE family protein [soil metagenome]